MGKNQHVVKHPDGWAVKGAGNSKATKVVKTQLEAVNYAREIAMNQKSEMLIHGRKGQIIITRKNDKITSPSLLDDLRLLR